MLSVCTVNVLNQWKLNPAFWTLEKKTSLTINMFSVNPRPKNRTVTCVLHEERTSRTETELQVLISDTFCSSWAAAGQWLGSEATTRQAIIRWGISFIWSAPVGNSSQRELWSQFPVLTFKTLPQRFLILFLYIKNKTTVMLSLALS